MLYREFGKTGWNVSSIGMGTWNIGNQWGEIPEDVAIATVRSAFDNGVNLFDTAEVYGIPQGLSEERLGKALQGIRDRVHIVTKVGSWGRRTNEGLPKNVDNIRLCLHASLFRLKTDWVDALLCHEGDVEDPTVYLEAFEQLKQQGYLHAYGISTNSLDVLKQFNIDGKCSIVELDYSLLNLKAEATILPYCIEHNIAVIARKPLNQGLLCGKYAADTIFTDTVRAKWHKSAAKQSKIDRYIAAAQALSANLPADTTMATTALRYVISHPAQPVAIPGAKSPEQAAMNAQAGDRILTVDEQTPLLQSLQALTAEVG